MKKIILSFIIIISIFVLYNKIYAIPVSNTGAQSYVTAHDAVEATAKQKCYGTRQSAIDSTKSKWDENGGYFKLRVEWKQKEIYTAPYVKYIWREIIGGNVAYCLDPGLAVADDYTVKEKKLKKWSDLTEREKIYAVIYSADFTRLHLYAAQRNGTYYGLARDENTDYIIKQLLFWAYEANDIFEIKDLGYEVKFNYKFKTLAEQYAGQTLVYKHTTSSIIADDIYAAVLHYGYNENNPDKSHYKAVLNNQWAYQDVTSGSYLVFKSEVGGVQVVEFDKLMLEVESILRTSFKKLQSRQLEEIAITRYVPTNGNTNDYQEFIGIYVKEEESDPKNKYAVLIKTDTGYYITDDYPNKYKDLTEDKTITANSNIKINGINYTFKNCDIYKSITGYGSPKDLVSNVVTPTYEKQSLPYKLSYETAWPYNVVVLNYKSDPEYNLKVEYYYKSASDSTYTLLGTGETQTRTKGSLIDPISVKFNDTYDGTLFVEAKLDDGTDKTTLTPSDGAVLCSMPGSNATIRIYYQYGQVAVSKYVRFNDGSKKQIGDTVKYNLTSDQNITLSESISYDGTTYYYFKFIKNGGTSYYNASGCSAGSSVKNSKGKSNVTIDIYYGLRRIDYAHKIVDGPTIESNKIYRYEGDGKVKWGEDKQILTAKTTPLYTKINNYEYVKLNYKNYSSKSGSTIIAESSVTFSTSGNTNKTFDLAALGAKENDSTRVHFYYEKIESTKVVVRHFVKQSNGTYVRNDSLANPKTGVQNVEKEYGTVKKGQGIVVNNKYSQRKSVVNGKIDTLTDYEIKAIYTGSYSEFYEIDKNDSITIDRSRVLISDGIYYKCEGFSLLKSSNTPIKTNPLGENNISSSKAIKDKRLSQTITGNDYVFIDYYYEPVSYSTNVESIGNSARLKYMPKAAGTYSSLGNNNSVVNSTTSGAKESDNIAYVPVTENLKPYVVTDKFRVRTAIYDIDNEGKYTVGSYQTWAVSDDSNMASVGSVVGNGNNLVYDANKGSLNVSDVNTLRSERAATYDVVKSIKNAFEGNATSAHTTFNSILTNVASAKTNEAFYADSANYNISSTKYNGLRKTTGSINYKIYNVTSSSNSSAATGNNTMAISEANSMSVNIYTPATVGEAKIKSIDFVNHSNSNSVSIIQQGVTFSVTVSAKKDTAYSSNVYNQITNTGKYIKYWYLMFDFDVAYNGVTYGANTPILVNAANNAYAETTISGLHAVTTSTDRELVESTLNHIKVIAGTANLPSQDYARTQLGRTDAKKVDTSTKHIDNLYVKQRTSASSPQSQSDGLGMQYDSYYLVSNVQENLSVGRIFDFEITDCLDVNFKDVFRILTSEEEIKNSTYSPINVLTGTRYFSGIRRLMVTDSVTSSTTNNLVNRGNLDAGAVKKILPLGPYKHTTNTYIKAVKLGYRFSFDLKTSGYYSPKENTSIERYVKVTPSYYYISKDGKTYNDNIKLYYKNSSGKYVDFETSNYTIYYKPDDGYRNLYNSSTYQETDVSKTTKDGVTTLTSSLVGLKIGSNQGFTLSDTKSMTISDAGYLQAWYGEFKLPNSTVALAVDASGNVDINNSLTNGYIGVKFNLECVDTYTNNRTVTISYNSQDKGLGNNQVNTSQWDYEGYLGFKEANIGKELQNNINIQLENGVWSVDANTYKAIKGTVIFYDLDDRAANDYD